MKAVSIQPVCLAGKTVVEQSDQGAVAAVVIIRPPPHQLNNVTQLVRAPRIHPRYGAEVEVALAGKGPGSSPAPPPLPVSISLAAPTASWSTVTASMI